MTMSKHFELRELKEFGDGRGRMCVVETNQELPFEIKRFFYDFNTGFGESRGNHANVNSQFAFVSLAGSCTVDVDDGENQETFLLDIPTKLLWVDKMVWKVMRNFSPDNVLLVVSDQHYDSGEYIRDYDQFVKMVKGGHEV